MRLDRFITLNLVRPFRRTRLTPREPRRTPLSILMYHSISDGREENSSPYYQTCTTPAVFARQMDWLKDNGYRGVTLSTGLNSELRTPNSELRPVVITFDDGFRDFHTAAFPILKQHGFSATMYLPTAFIQDGPLKADHRSSSPPRPGRGLGEVSNDALNSSPFKNKAFLNWSEIRELHSAGIEFGSHTVTHPKLVDCHWDEIESEICDSKSGIEAQLGVPCVTFAYPYAFPGSDRQFVASFSEVLKNAGYQHGVTTGIGRVRQGENPFTLNRLPVNSLDDPELFQAKLDGDYDWLALPQAMVKKLKHLVRRSKPATRTKFFKVQDSRIEAKPSASWKQN